VSAFAVHRIAALDCRVDPFDWSFERERAGEIASHWARLVAERPAMYDGRVLLCRSVEIAPEGGGVLTARFFETSFSAFIAWRDFGFPDRDIRNCFSMAALRSSDGAFLLGEMGAQTANAGKCYFPAGTPDLSDVTDGAVDLAGSVARELHEETGIDIAEGEVDPVWTVVTLGLRVACLRAVRLRLHADAIVARAADILAAQDSPELAGLRPVRSLADLESLDTPDFIRAYLEYELGH
jgi:8-oxo-dGTP pyrophosphatase MutT (NUDIX family)